MFFFLVNVCSSSSITFEIWVYEMNDNKKKKKSIYDDIQRYCCTSIQYDAIDRKSWRSPI